MYRCPISDIFPFFRSIRYDIQYLKKANISAYPIYRTTDMHSLVFTIVMIKYNWALSRQYIIPPYSYTDTVSIGLTWILHWVTGQKVEANWVLLVINALFYATCIPVYGCSRTFHQWPCSGSIYSYLVHYRNFDLGMNKWIGPPCAPWCTTQPGGAQHRSVVHNTVLYPWGGTQCRFQKPGWTDRQTLPNVLSPLIRSRWILWHAGHNLALLLPMLCTNGLECIGTPDFCTAAQSVWG